MGNQKFFILYFLLSILSVYASENCPVSRCSSDNIPIRFPFRLEGLQTKDCGYPGFDLSCNNQSKTVVKFPYAGDFLVRSIDYTTQQIQLYDSGICLPNRLMSLNLSGSPFVPAGYQNYTFLSCPTPLVESRFITISCLSNSTISVLATSSRSIVASLSTSCRIITSSLIPISLSVKNDEWFSSQLGDDLELTWYSPNCNECETKGGICGYKSNTSQAIGCFDNSKEEKSPDALRTLRVIWLSVAAPFAIIVCGIVIFTVLVFRLHVPNSRRVNQTTAAESLQPNIAMVGLDENTIESYEKVTLGESMRLPEGPNDSTCAICLSEYHSKEIVRCIPECNHFFHVGCIDEWLRLNNSCPVCRNSPAPSPIHAISESV
ncbi:putative RING-H2 finger protein ATL21A isoform X1 [Euphorbia lathyris]|uniref:putative RING-H2 finger protein ATL21A isoform X1 n=1 Tax=Euphorbia lathyris TaxID=212925 RepID=UPI00331330C6